MQLKHLSQMLMMLVGAAVLALASSASRAMPAAGLNDIILEGERLAIEQVDYRRCWWRSGKRHCRWVTDNRRKRANIPRDENSNLPPNLGIGIGM